MTDTQTEGIETSQAAREASGARQYGRYLEEFEVGAVYKHWPAKTVTEADDHLFCLLTMNTTRCTSTTCTPVSRSRAATWWWGRSSTRYRWA